MSKFKVQISVLFVSVFFSASATAITFDECLEESGATDRLEAKKWWDISSDVINAFKSQSSHDLAALMRGLLISTAK